jgi:GH15 family glucan-1,4-alpha-glucosidase
MPRELTIGNGTLQVMFDAVYRLRDIYFPHVGKENHTAGHTCRFGVFAEEQLSWTDEAGWERELAHEPETLVTSVSLLNRRLGLAIACRDAVDFHENVYLRQTTVRNLLPRAREVRLFFHHDFHLYGNNIGDTALYEPRLQALIHYKARRYFLISILAGDETGVQEWATGYKEHDGAEGTWRDAEDGRLGRNPIAQGSVDSTIAVPLSLSAQGQSKCYYWIAAGTKYREVQIINSVVRDKTPLALIDRTAAYWRLWATKSPLDRADLPPQVAELFTRSLLILRTYTDSRGGIVAANDSDLLQRGRDTYSYVWPRDGARATYALTRAGYLDIPRGFFNFCARALTDDGYLLHKYNPDGSLGSSWHPWYARGQMEIPIQEDETALVLWALWQHFSRHKDLEFIKPLYRPLIIRAADFLEDYRSDRTKLPRPSYDLWEERFGVHTFTVASVYAGLQAAAGFADSFSESTSAAKYRKAAAEIQDAAKRILYSSQDQRFARRFDPETEELDMTADASLFGIAALGLFPVDEPMVASTMRQVEDRLRVRTGVGGIARYERDAFFHVTDDFGTVPGNPWAVCTLWLAQYRIAAARSPEELARAREILGWVARHARPSGVLPEQFHPFDGSCISVCPLGWSHAEFVISVLDYLEKRHALEGKKPWSHQLEREKKTRSAA